MFRASIPMAVLATILVAAAGGCRSDAVPVRDPRPPVEETAATEASRIGGDWSTTTAYCVEPNGRTSSVKTHCPSGDPELDRVQQEAIERWTFEPARQAGRPVRSCTTVQAKFRFRPPPKATPASPGIPMSIHAKTRPAPDPERLRMVTMRYRERGCRFIQHTAFCIEPTGAVVEATTVRGSGIEDLDVVLQETVETWEFAPVIVDGAPVRTCTTTEFNLEIR